MVQGAEETGPVDLIFVTVKYGALSAILPAVTALTDSRTMIISLMNGVDSEAVLEAAVGKGHIVPALLRIASHRERGKEGIDQVTFKVSEDFTMENLRPCHNGMRYSLKP